MRWKFLASGTTTEATARRADCESALSDVGDMVVATSSADEPTCAGILLDGYEEGVSSHHLRLDPQESLPDVPPPSGSGMQHDLVSSIS